jgi:hypothetical protein
LAEVDILPSENIVDRFSLFRLEVNNSLIPAGAPICKNLAKE